MKHILIGFLLIVFIFLNSPHVERHKKPQEYSFQVILNYKNDFHVHQDNEYLADLIDASSINYGDPIGSNWVYQKDFLLENNYSFGIRFF